MLLQHRRKGSKFMSPRDFTYHSVSGVIKLLLLVENVVKFSAAVLVLLNVASSLKEYVAPPASTNEYLGIVYVLCGSEDEAIASNDNVLVWCPTGL